MNFEKITLPTPLGIGPVNVYLIKSSPVTLIDTGVKTDKSYAELECSLRRLGLEVRDVERIVITHAHPDHYGMAQRLKEITGASVYMHSRECAKMEGEWHKFDSGRTALMVEAGAPEDVVADILQGIAFGRRLLDRIVDPQPVEDGHRFQFDGFALEAIHLPGHSSGHICLYERNSRVLFSGDHLLKDISPNPTIEPSSEEANGRTKSLESYLLSLERLRGIDIAVAMSAHGDPIEDVPAKIDDLIHHHRKRADLIHRKLSEKDQSAYALARRLFPNVTGYEVYLAVSEVIAHLDLLIGQGRVSYSRPNGVYLYRLK